MNRRPTLPRDQALRIMLDYVGARVQVATIDELRLVRWQLDTLLDDVAFAGQDGASKIVKGLAELVFIESQLRDEDVEAHLRRLLDEPQVR